MSDNSRSVPTNSPSSVATVTVLSEGNELPRNWQLLSLNIQYEVNRIPSASLIFQDGEVSAETFPVSDGAELQLGKAIEIKAGYQGNDEMLFKGLVIKQSIKIRQSRSMLVVECKDEVVKMTGSPRCAYFVKQKDSDVIESIIQANGLQADVTATDFEHEQLVQYNATDWDFVQMRAEANGLLCLADAGKLTVSKPDPQADPVLSLRYGATILEMDMEMDARQQPKAVKGFGWNQADQAITEVEAAEPTTTNNGNLTAIDLAGVLDQDAYQLFHGGALAEQELKAWSDGYLLKSRFAKLRGSVKCQGFSGVKPGNIIELAGVGERFNGKAFVSGVNHQVAQGNWQTDIQIGLDPEPFAERVELSACSTMLTPKIDGLQIGVVTALEGDPASEERIQVRLPIVNKDEDGTWARLATLDAGENRGSFFRPEIGDEVLVGFIGQDPRHAVVLGGLHSSAKPAPEPASDDNHKKGYVSRSEMKMVFDDEKKSIKIETPKGNFIELSEDTGGISITDENGNKLTLDSNGVTIESAKDIIFKAASGDLKIEAINVQAKAQANFKAEGSAGAELSASGNTVVKGAMVQIN